MDDDGSGVFPTKKVRKLYNEKYQKTYSNRYYVLKNEFIKIEEYVVHIQGYNEGQQVMYI